MYQLTFTISCETHVFFASVVGCFYKLLKKSFPHSHLTISVEWKTSLVGYFYIVYRHRVCGNFTGASIKKDHTEHIRILLFSTVAQLTP